MRYALVLSGHGARNQRRLPHAGRELTRRPFNEGTPGSTRQGDSIIRHIDHRKFDILGFDACFMSMGEVALEVRALRRHSRRRRGNGTRVWLAVSTAHRQGKGTREREKGHPTPENLAREIVEEYVTHYNDFDRTAGRSADLAAIDLRKLDDVVTSFQALVTRLKGLDKPGATTSCCSRIGTRRRTSSTNTLISRTCV